MASALLKLFLFVSTLGLARKEAYKQKKWLKEPRNPVAKVCREARGKVGIGVTERSAVANSSHRSLEMASLQTPLRRERDGLRPP